MLGFGIIAVSICLTISPGFDTLPDSDSGVQHRNQQVAGAGSGGTDGGFCGG